jgi:hypothetical protein
MPVERSYLTWFKLKCPYAENSTSYKHAYARLEAATYADLVALQAEFDAYADGSVKVVHYKLCDEWLASIGQPPRFSNMKGIQQHGARYRVEKRINGKLHRWSFDNLTDASAKRDLIFA